jgi:hypothetical protein
MHRIQRKQALQSLQYVGKQKAEDAESDERRGVSNPRLLDILTYSPKPVDQPLQRPQDRVQECALPFEDAIHEQARRLRESKDDQKENQYLCNAENSHKGPFLEAFRPKQCVHQVNEEQDRRHSGNGVFHFKSPFGNAHRRSAALVKPHIKTKKTITTAT